MFSSLYTVRVMPQKRMTWKKICSAHLSNEKRIRNFSRTTYRKILKYILTEMGLNNARLDSSGSANDQNKAVLSTTIHIPQKGGVSPSELLASQKACCSVTLVCQWAGHVKQLVCIQHIRHDERTDLRYGNYANTPMISCNL